ncbi:hypothetical protein B5M42_017190 [Paenibacillus athensensis]|uniref:Uncharacterized protein n=1 Tax=Paenibacillus athensensis TaxID=1967502 RepID=A0A4Y8PS95_9BACL|nr:hypothetical protein [Paenibacillus athensensis]MCD1260539.1 hypothetical protein [Paenibacillus athensensis]
MFGKLTARINWIPTEQGGKNRFPIRDYSTVAHFLEDDPEQGWSVVLKIDANPESYMSICDLSFLFPERIPKNLIHVGSKFMLFESKKVADGEIIDIFSN